MLYIDIFPNFINIRGEGEYFNIKPLNFENNASNPFLL